MKLFGGKVNHLYGYTNLNVFNRRSLEIAAQLGGFEVVSFRTEWLDIYYADLMALTDDPDGFIHKRNSHRPNYTEQICAEDKTQKQMNIDLGDQGNYLVAVLKPSDKT